MRKKGVRDNFRQQIGALDEVEARLTLIVKRGVLRDSVEKLQNGVRDNFLGLSI